MTGHPTVACSLRKSETSSVVRGLARHWAEGRAKIRIASQPSALPARDGVEGATGDRLVRPQNMGTSIRVSLDVSIDEAPPIR